MSATKRKPLSSPLSPIIGGERIYKAKMSFKRNYAKEHVQILSSIMSERLTSSEDMKAGVCCVCVCVCVYLVGSLWSNDPVRKSTKLAVAKAVNYSKYCTMCVCVCVCPHNV